MQGSAGASRKRLTARTNSDLDLIQLFMKRPWHVWLVFLAGVVGAALAMAWLTRQALHADRLRRVAEAEAELEQRVSLALWRMDTELAPIVAEEVIRPPSAYRATFPTTPPPYVVLQFEAGSGRPLAFAASARRSTSATAGYALIAQHNSPSWSRRFGCRRCWRSCPRHRCLLSRRRAAIYWPKRRPKPPSNGPNCRINCSFSRATAPRRANRTRHLN